MLGIGRGLGWSCVEGLTVGSWRVCSCCDREKRGGTIICEFERTFGSMRLMDRTCVEIVKGISKFASGWSFYAQIHWQVPSMACLISHGVRWKSALTDIRVGPRERINGKTHLKV